MRARIFAWLLLLIVMPPLTAWSWHDETHLAIAKAAGYEKWYNAAGADITKIKAGLAEQGNHYCSNRPGTVVTGRMVIDQARYYNHRFDIGGHLYGAIIAAIREYRTTRKTGKYAEYHLAFCAHYIGDLSQPLHNIHHSDYNKSVHAATDGTIENEVLYNLPLVETYPIQVRNEAELADEIARIANLSMALGFQLERENRMLSRQEAYRQIGHSVSLLKAVLQFVGKQPR